MCFPCFYLFVIYNIICKFTPCTAQQDFLVGLRRLADESGALLVFDEV